MLYAQLALPRLVEFMYAFLWVGPCHDLTAVHALARFLSNIRDDKTLKHMLKPLQGCDRTRWTFKANVVGAPAAKLPSPGFNLPLSGSFHGRALGPVMRLHTDLCHGSIALAKQLGAITMAVNTVSSAIMGRNR